MLSPKNELIARKCFASLYLDYEFTGSDSLPASVSCRVLIDGCYNCHLYAATREEAIEKFYQGTWKEEA